MSNDIAIKVENLAKSFRLPHEKQSSVKGLFLNAFQGKKNYEKQRVLKGVSFEIKKGEFFGIVGRNGSGKSTLLKLLAGIYSPDEGRVRVNGRLTPFIELGVGFSPDLSGRDNVYLNGALLGFSHKEMDAMYDEIVKFAELEDHMDKKLRNYSSGMQVRLAFSIAVRAKTGILLVDEVLAVGDEAFQQKCLDIFEQYKAQKRTVVLVTHDMQTVKDFCENAILLDQGRIMESGRSVKVAATYSRLNLAEVEGDIAKKALNKEDNNLGLVIKYKNKLTNKHAFAFECGDTILLDLTYRKSPLYPYIVINVYKKSGEHVTGFRVATKSGETQIELEALLSKGKYYILVQAVDVNDAAVGDVVVGDDFIITTDRAPGLPGWSGLVPMNYKVVKD